MGFSSTSLVCVHARLCIVLSVFAVVVVFAFLVAVKELGVVHIGWLVLDEVLLEYLVFPTQVVSKSLMQLFFERIVFLCLVVQILNLV